MNRIMCLAGLIIFCHSLTVSAKEYHVAKTGNDKNNGTSNDRRIVYRAAPREKVIIKGSEVVKGWKKLEGYIAVKGFKLEQAAIPWAPPTAEQIGLIGTHWSKGWIIIIKNEDGVYLEVGMDIDNL